MLIGSDDFAYVVKNVPVLTAALGFASFVPVAACQIVSEFELELELSDIVIVVQGKAARRGNAIIDRSWACLRLFYISLFMNCFK